MAITVPKLNWVLRAAYSYFYQPPPLDTVTGSLLDFTQSQGLGFLPLQGERDIQQEYGITIPVRNWVSTITYFHTSVRNFFDHDVIGNSNIFLPLTIQGAIIEGEEATIRSPLILHRYHAHLVYSHQLAQGVGAVTGGLTDFSPPPGGAFYLDHDQRNTLSAGFDGDLPWRSFAAVTINYGSGFLNGDGPRPSARLLHVRSVGGKVVRRELDGALHRHQHHPTSAISWTTAIPSAARIGPIPPWSRCR